jgi:hypothetical protein
LGKVDSPPIYLGYKDEIKLMLAHTARVPVKEMANGFKATSTASFIIDSIGKIKDIKIERPGNVSFDQSVIRAIRIIDGEWIPARVNNMPVDSKMFVLIHISNSSSSFKTDDKPYVINIDIVYRDIVYRGVQSSYSVSRTISVPAGSRPGSF